MTDERFFDEFAEDFFAESTEHLATIRRSLLALEESAQASTAAPASRVTELMRSLHTLKGLCGMVGLTSAASVAHAVEELLRQAGVGSTAVRAELVELLFAAARTLDSCLNAFRTGHSAPDVTSVLSDLRHYEQGAGQREPSEEAVATSQERATYLFTFTPSPALAARGIGVEVVRTRLQSLGTVVSVSPRVKEDGAIRFEFAVLMEPDRAPAEEWRDDAMDWRIDAAAPPVAPSAPIAETETALPRSNLVRVELARLDELMLLVGGLVMSRARLQDCVERLATDRSNAAVSNAEDASELIERQLRDLRTAVMRVRLVPVGEAFERMRFVARDVVRETGKQARVVVEGGATEIDKIVVERILEPLLHLVRNAISHGLETAAERSAVGKDPIGTITLRAESAGDEIVIRVQDDGRGIDVERIRAAAEARGIPRPQIDQARDILDILCLPGFSTQETADLTSGRGVGMAVVRSTVRELGGDLLVDSEPGQGTSFVIRLPLTLMIVDALLVSVAGQTLAVPQPNLREVLMLERSEIVAFEKNEVMRYRGGVLPLLHLRSVFGAPASTAERCNVLVVGSDADSVGLVADRIVGLREIVVRSLADPLVAVPGIAGAAELSDGSVTLILDTGGLIRFANENKRMPLGALQQGQSA